MKRYRYIISIIIGIMLSSCGKSSVKIDPNLSPEETQAVINTDRSLPADAQIESYQVVKSTLPLEMMEKEYKTFRDEANKARIDYRTNMTRGLQQVAKKNLETLENIQNTIREKSSNINASSPEYIFVLANVKEAERKDGALTGYIAIYDKSNLEQVGLIQVTTPLYNNAVMVTQALDGTLIDPSHDNENLKSSNPVANFILNTNPK